MAIAIFPLDKIDKIQMSLLKAAQLINFSALYFIIYKEYICKGICFSIVCKSKRLVTDVNQTGNS